MVEIAKWKQVYMTTSVPADDSGNYYYPALVPANAVVQLPLTEVVPDPALGGRGLKFDWGTNTWNTSDEDPTNKKLNEMQQTINGLTANQLGMIADQVNTEPAPVKPSQPASASSATSDSASGSQSGSTGVPDLSDMASVLNNPELSKGDNK